MGRTWPGWNPSHVLRSYADQRCIHGHLLNFEIPTCFKKTTIIPVLTKCKIACLNDYFPVALISTNMKCFKRLVMVTSTTASQTLLLHCILPTTAISLWQMSSSWHFCHPWNIRITRTSTLGFLFIDYSCNFNTLFPTKTPRSRTQRHSLQLDTVRRKRRDCIPHNNSQPITIIHIHSLLCNQILLKFFSQVCTWQHCNRLDLEQWWFQVQ